MTTKARQVVLRRVQEALVAVPTGADADLQLCVAGAEDSALEVTLGRREDVADGLPTPGTLKRRYQREEWRSGLKIGGDGREKFYTPLETR
jgi:hypothetical protein